MRGPGARARAPAQGLDDAFMDELERTTQASCAPSLAVTARLWALNLDAEEEIRDGATGELRDPSRFARERPALVASLVGALVPEGDAVLGLPSQIAAHGEALRLAWAPTTAARTALARAGVTRVVGARPEVLARVLDRRFMGEALGLLLDGARWIDAPSELERSRCARRLETPTCANASGSRGAADA
ncbi:MAG: hypothetical protein U0271_46620 [Polyangiaceae bacterium]